MSIPDDVTTRLPTVSNCRHLSYTALVEIREIERALTSGDMMGMNGLSRFSDFPFARIKALGSRWIKLNKLLDQWWNLFWKTFILTSHRRNGRLVSKQELQIGVLVHDLKGVRGKWPIGRVTKILLRAGQNESRSVEVLVDGKRYVRSVGNLSFLTPGN